MILGLYIDMFVWHFIDILKKIFQEKIHFVKHNGSSTSRKLLRKTWLAALSPGGLATDVKANNCKVSIYLPYAK